MCIVLDDTHLTLHIHNNAHCICTHDNVYRCNNAYRQGRYTFAMVVYSQMCIVKHVLHYIFMMNVYILSLTIHIYGRYVQLSVYHQVCALKHVSSLTIHLPTYRVCPLWRPSLPPLWRGPPPGSPYWHHELRLPHGWVLVLLVLGMRLSLGMAYISMLLQLP